MMELLGYFDTDEISLEQVFLKTLTPEIINKQENTPDIIGEKETQEPPIPDVLPILPLRGLVVYPQTVVPLTIGQQRSIRLVDDVVTGDQRIIGLVTSKNPELEQPEPEDLYSVGTAAVVHRLFRAPDGTIRLVVQGIARYRILEFIQTEP
ncbi:MAG: LON peptidase substrate-binding domain-containing protein, partial [Anaerolineales bacterium]